MSSGSTVLHITDDELKLLWGQWPNFAGCARKERAVNSDLSVDLKQMVSSLKLRDESCLLVVSRRDVILKALEFPSADAQEIQKMLALQIPMIVPFDETQVIYRCRLIRTKESGHSDVVSAVVLNNTIQKYIDAVYAAGLSVADVYISFDSNTNYEEKFLTPQFKDIFSCALMICGRHSSEMVILQEGRSVFSYYLTYGKKDIVENAGEFCSAIKNSASDYEKNNPGQKIQNIYLSPQMLESEKMIDCLAEGKSWGIEKVDFFSRLPGSVADFIQEKGLDEDWLPLLGCFYQDEKSSFKSFLPMRIHSSKAKEKNQRKALRFLVALVSALALTMSLFSAILHKHEKRLEAVNEKVSDLGPRLQKLEAENSFLNIIAQHDGGRDSIVDRIKDVYEMLSDDVSLQYFGMRAKGDFELQGIALKDQNVNQLQAALVASEFFQKVNLQYATKRKRFNKEYTEFKITFQAIE